MAFAFESIVDTYFKYGSPSSINMYCSRTPLYWAAVCDNPDVIRALLAAEGNY